MMEDTYGDWIGSARQAELTPYADALLESLAQSPPTSDSFLSHIKEFLLGNADVGLRLPTWLLPALLLILLSRLADQFEQILGEKKSVSAFRYILQWLLVAAVLAPIAETAQLCCAYMQDLTLVFGTLTPVIGILLASGGNLATAGANHLLLSVFLSGAEFLTQRAVPAVLALFFGFAVMGAVGDGDGARTVANWLRGTLFGIFSLVTTLFFIVIGYQNIAAINTDTVTAKTLKALIGNAVPIVGGALGDALRLVGGGLSAVRSTVGLAAVLFLLGVFVPVALTIFVQRTALSFLGMLCENRSLAASKGFFLQIRYAFDFMAAAFSVIFALCILNLGIFLGTLPGAVIG